MLKDGAAGDCEICAQNRNCGGTRAAHLLQCEMPYTREVLALSKSIQKQSKLARTKLWNESLLSKNSVACDSAVSSLLPLVYCV